jgi:hypothetical protein
MTKHLARHAVLSETATFDEKTGELRVVIETPKGSRNNTITIPTATVSSWPRFCPRE